MRRKYSSRNNISCLIFKYARLAESVEFCCNINALILDITSYVNRIKIILK